jgi:phage baseplate assembly protein W
VPDIAHTFGNDLQASANGDLLTSDSLQLSQEMVLRRLLTNPGDYIWHPDYGAGLPAMIGKPIDIATVKSIIQAQMFLEASVVRTPAPVIDVSEIPNGMFVEIEYLEADSQQTATLSFPVNP